MKFSLFLLFMGAYRNNIISKTKLYFELGNNDDIILKNNKTNIIIKNKPKNSDAALLPLKDQPKHPLLW